MSFIIFALPRSRTAWLAHYLNYSPRRVGHDIAINCNSPEDFLTGLDSMDGTVETGAIVAWRLLRAKRPETKFVTVHRPLVEVMRSLEAAGARPRLDELAARDVMLRELAKQPGVLSLDWRELDEPSTAGGLFEWLLELPCDSEWHGRLRGLNIQVDMRARLAQLSERGPELAELLSAVRQQTLQLSGLT